MSSELLLTAGTTPATPGAGKLKVFAKSSSKKLAQVDDAGVVTELGLGGGAVTQSTPADPTGTANTTGLHMGLGVTLTPVATGRVLIIVSGNITNSTAAAGDGAKTQIRYGTGSAPANAAALTGSPIGNIVSMLLERATASDPFPFSIQAVLTGLTLNTQIWVDISLAAIAGGTAVAKNLSVSIVEI